MTYHSFYALSIIILNITRSMHSRACSSLFPIRTTVLFFNSFQSHCDVQSTSNPRIFSTSRARNFSAHGESRLYSLLSGTSTLNLKLLSSLLAPRSSLAVSPSKSQASKRWDRIDLPMFNVVAIDWLGDQKKSAVYPNRDE